MLRAFSVLRGKALSKWTGPSDSNAVRPLPALGTGARKSNHPVIAFAMPPLLEK